MWNVYVLLSLKDKRSYVGSTNALLKRIDEHNRGLVRSTKSRIPFKLVYKEEYDTEQEARKKEKYYKTAAGRRKLKQIFDNL